MVSSNDSALEVFMTRILISVASVAIALASLSVSASAATDGALVGLHDLRREGGKTCMSDHSHSGSSNGEPSRNRAEAGALRNWSDFTSLEYGAHWGSPALAGSKEMKCSQGVSGWSCEFEARPCRR
jgi:hypothetical protein